MDGETSDCRDIAGGVGASAGPALSDVAGGDHQC